MAGVLLVRLYRRSFNSKNVGRLLAAGVVYNGNVEGFRQTAEQLGGDAPVGYEQVLNEGTKGTAIAAASILCAISKSGSAGGIAQIEKLAGGCTSSKIFSKLASR